MPSAAFLEGMLEAYPEELSSMSVVMAAFRAHQLPLRNAYFDRFPPPPDERTPMTVPRLLPLTFATNVALRPLSTGTYTLVDPTR